MGWGKNETCRISLICVLFRKLSLKEKSRFVRYQDVSISLGQFIKKRCAYILITPGDGLLVILIVQPF